MERVLFRVGATVGAPSMTPTLGAGRPERRSFGALAGLLTATNVVTTLLPDRAYVPLKLAAAAAAGALARRDGAELDDLGLRRDRLGAGALLGLAGAAAVAGAIAAGSATATGRDVVRGMAPAGTQRSVRADAFVRIPLGTALAEELLFRSALLGVLLRQHHPRRAVRTSSVAFGLWHVVPTLVAVGEGRRYGRAGAALGAGGHVVTAVLTTTAAGEVLAWLRLRSGSVLAPTLVHAAANSVGLLRADAASG